jgi:hypothetical protein
MKQMRNLINFFMAGAVALAMVATLDAQTTGELAAKVVRIKGNARFTTGNNVWQPLKVGQVIHPGTIIQTGMDTSSYVDLSLGSGAESSISPVVYNSAPSTSAPPPSSGYESKASQSIVRVAENTLLGVDKLTALNTGSEEITETQLDLKAGHILFNVKKLSAASRFEVKLPNGVAGIRGTAGVIWSTGLVQCIAGSVVRARIDANGVSHADEIVGGQQQDADGNITPLPESVMKNFPADVLHPTPPGPPSHVPFNPIAIEHVSPHIPGNQ